MNKCYYCGHDANTSGLCDPCDHRVHGRITGSQPAKDQEKDLSGLDESDDFT